MLGGGAWAPTSSSDSFQPVWCFCSSRGPGPTPRLSFPLISAVHRNKLSPATWVEATHTALPATPKHKSGRKSLRLWTENYKSEPPQWNITHLPFLMFSTLALNGHTLFLYVTCKKEECYISLESYTYIFIYKAEVPLKTLHNINIIVFICVRTSSTDTFYKAP